MNSSPAPGIRSSGAHRSFPLAGHAWALGGLGVVIVVLVGVTWAFAGRGVWSAWEESRGLRQPSYAEAIYPDAVFRTRANTWSNLAYVLVGFYAFALARWDRSRAARPEDGYLVRTPALSVLFGLACCALGAGSGLFHASLTRLGQQLDVAAMYPPMLVIIAVSVGRRWPDCDWLRSGSRRPTWPLAAVVVAGASWLLFRYKWSMSSLAVLSTLILLVTGLSVWDRRRLGRRLDGRWLLLSAAALAAAIICRQLDVAGRFSGPDAWYQGHALWHVLTAASLACLYGYHRTEAGLAPGR